ncbi:MAG: sigma-70 family RNA polymerase sigma factor [Erysipelotrichaceae bacterium]|nr:sigma-70 family RNA polymerase sigma factor [Erysipelotrichaceae bacterium]
MDETVLELIHLAQLGDMTARERLMKENMGLVYSITGRFRNHSCYQDLNQIGAMGLLKAILNFDGSFEVRFSTYAVPIILGEIKRFFRDEGQMKVSRSLKENYLKIMKAKEILSQQSQSEPTIAMIAKMCELDEADVILAMEANQQLTSLDSASSGKDGSQMRIDERISDDANQDIEMKVALEMEIQKTLSQREQLIMYYRYHQDLNQQAIAEKLSISQVQVSRLEKKIYEKLEHKLTVQ